MPSFIHAPPPQAITRIPLSHREWARGSVRILSLFITLLLTLTGPITTARAEEIKFFLGWGRLEQPVPAPHLIFHTRAGEPVALDELKNKAHLVHFWASWCAPCILEMPDFLAFADKAKQEGIGVYLISLDYVGDIEELKRNLKKAKLPEDFDTLYVKDLAVWQNMGLLDLPTTLVMDRKGVVLRKFSAKTDWEAKETLALIEKLIQN